MICFAENILVDTLFLIFLSSKTGSFRFVVRYQNVITLSKQWVQYLRNEPI